MMTFANNNGSNAEADIRCATYARYSSDVQRPTSIDDQVRNWVFR
jgi:hypothetical protein